jgi:hypothetical protein
VSRSPSQQRAIDQLKRGPLSAGKWTVSPSDARALMREGIVKEIRNYPGGVGTMYSYEIRGKREDR